MKWHMIFLVFAPIILSCFPLLGGASLDVAMEKYQAAEKSHSSEERSRLFNEALAMYLPYTKVRPSGELLTNVGNIYFYLGDLGLAIAYYRDALVESPRNGVIQKNLSVAIEKAHVYGAQMTNPVADGVALRWLSPYERIMLVIGVISISFVLFSLNVWLPSFGFRGVYIASTFLTVLLLVVLGLYALFMPVHAVIVRETELRTAISQEPASSSVVLHPGEMVEILSYDSTQEWLRVRTVTGLPGYLPAKTVYCIQKE